jgi:hypothetical protein
MQIVSELYDGRINARNYLIEMTAGEYLPIAKKILDSNEFQRRKVKSSNTVYSLLKEDFLKGCILPPIVLGLNSVSKIEKETISGTLFEKMDDLVILDGLQRTYSLIDLESEIAGNLEELEKFNESKLRIEIYTSINRLGVLYRMLTLNTGQSPMSIRHQIEMLYLGYLKKPIEGIKLIREVDDDSPKLLGEYTFKSVADGFNAYIERNELPIDRGDILENIKGIERLSLEKSEENLFQNYIVTYNKFVKKYDELLGHFEVSSEDLDISGQPFGKNLLKIFCKSQPMTGFGAAIGKLRDINSGNNFESTASSIEKLKSSKSVNEATLLLLNRMEKIRLHSKKIGNSQRLFFVYFFRELFNPESESYCDIYNAVEEAYRKYETQVM